MTNVPSQRSNHTAVWTGTKMLVWGGVDAGTYRNDGGIYDPGTDTWTASGITTSNAPTARADHTAIWTGTHMIIWGGHDGTSAFHDGKKYDPISDTWTSISLPGGLFNTKEITSAIWTGTKMILWGGFITPGSVYYNDGGIFDPSLDAWSSLNNIGAPTVRANNTATWTSNGMIVWGGYNGSTYENTGAMFLPGSDTWEPLGTDTSPSARASHTAVWTGSALWIWGGSNGANLNNGYIYQP
jgi:hypothetical protein